MFLRFSLTSLFFISQVTAAVPNSPLFSRGSPHALLARQQNRGPMPTPAGCESTCGGGILNQLGICISTLCLCTETNAQELEDCIECIVGTAPSRANINIGQGVLDKFSDVCKNSTLPALTVTAAPADTTAAPESIIFPTIPVVITVAPTSSGVKATATGGASPSTLKPSTTPGPTKDNSAAGFGTINGMLATMIAVGGVLAVIGL